MNNDLNVLHNSLYNSTISGPWRLTVWDKEGHPPSYVFSEEHASEGSCPDQRDISSVIRDVLENTSKTEVFIEHFVHAEDIVNPRREKEQACVAKSSAILNGLRLCLEVVKIGSTHHGERIHFCDPRCDIVSIMPDGKVYQAISAYVHQLVADNNTSDALLTLYEAFIHPLLSVVPDHKSMGGRLTGTMKSARENMTPEQRKFFDEMWELDVVTSIKGLTETYSSMHKSNSVGNVAQFMTQYTRTINKFMDTWLLAKMFQAENKGMSSSVLYMGSLHSLNIEKYLERYGYRRASIHENKNLGACLTIT